MKVPIEDIKKTLERVLTDKGVENETAAILAKDYLEGELQGKQSHGLMAFPALLEKADTFGSKRHKVLKKTSSLISVDANALPGAYVGRKVADELLEMAKKEGVAVGYIRNMMTWLRPAVISQHLLDSDMVSLVINDGGTPKISPSGGYDPVLGTNPIGIGVPSEDNPLIIDMATSKRAWGEVRKAKRFGVELPVDTFYTDKGEVAVNPDDAYSVKAAGDYKGFALALFIEIMAGSFQERPMEGGEMPDDQDYQTRTRGAMILVLNPKFTSDLASFKKANSDLFKKIKSGRKLDDVDEIFIPGERAFRNRASNLEKGYLEVEGKLWDKINA